MRSGGKHVTSQASTRSHPGPEEASWNLSEPEDTGTVAVVLRSDLASYPTGGQIVVRRRSA